MVTESNYILHFIYLFIVSKYCKYIVILFCFIFYYILYCHIVDHIAGAQPEIWKWPMAGVFSQKLGQTAWFWRRIWKTECKGRGDHPPHPLVAPLYCGSSPSGGSVACNHHPPQNTLKIKTNNVKNSSIKFQNNWQYFPIVFCPSTNWDPVPSRPFCRVTKNWFNGN